ncbi:unnamed protein product [Bursaphelenchus xylophilus]|uniref:(pine wood nematode) hypothetical protein n=1 Tax=Bursaphelenchus xylophilus TaxID=6326 RepID=A0A1I7S0M3_BURXY|nr:unnamed protein product [Bursaphelenchus xylophilus]CAG9132347.1 unnamed protein product [Bursaphelenchus xylophilus]
MMVGTATSIVEAKSVRSPPLIIHKTHDVLTEIYQRNIVIKNYKTCIGQAESRLQLPENFRGRNEGDPKELIITITRPRFPGRPMEIILDGVNPKWSSFKCAVRRSDDESDDLEFVDVKFVREINGDGRIMSGVFKEQIREDLCLRLTITVAEHVSDSQPLKSTLSPQPVNISKNYLKEQYSDFKIICSYENEDEVVIPVHKNILSVASPYFRAMFHDDTMESQAGQVTLTVVPYKALVEILYCVYHGEHSPAFKPNALDVLLAADFFEMVHLKDYTARFLGDNLGRSNVFRVIEVASKLNLNWLIKKACLFVKYEMTDNEAKAQFSALLSRNPELTVALLQMI